MTIPIEERRTALQHAANLIQKAADYTRADEMTERVNAQHVDELLAKVAEVLAPLHTAAEPAATVEAPAAACEPQARNDGATAAAQVSPATIIDVLRRTVTTALTDYQIPRRTVRDVVEQTLDEAHAEQIRDEGVQRIADALSPGPLTRTPEILDLARRLYDVAGELGRTGLLQR